MQGRPLTLGQDHGRRGYLRGTVTADPRPQGPPGYVRDVSWLPTGPLRYRARARTVGGRNHDGRIPSNPYVSRLPWTGRHTTLLPANRPVPADPTPTSSGPLLLVRRRKLVPRLLVSLTLRPLPRAWKSVLEGRVGVVTPTARTDSSQWIQEEDLLSRKDGTGRGEREVETDTPFTSFRLSLDSGLFPSPGLTDNQRTRPRQGRWGRDLEHQTGNPSLRRHLCGPERR